MGQVYTDEEKREYAKYDTDSQTESDYYPPAANGFFRLIYAAKTVCAILFLLFMVVGGWIGGYNLGQAMDSDIYVFLGILGAVVGLIIAVLALTPIACLLMIIDNTDKDNE